jgi:predicted ATPase/class 3 adenylate cyclase
MGDTEATSGGRILPSGTVTFLFTDIEGSTKLARGNPDIWETLRERHHAILRAAIESHNGYVFQIIGDAFCATFHTACDGLNAALDAQRKLQNEDWGETPVRVRMGLHTGSAQLHGSDYRGYLTMAKVQRVMSVAYGGQVLLSNASAELLHNELPQGITLRDMKEHRLKGLPDPERLWQMVAPDLQSDFPPLLSLKEIPNNLPVQLSTFIGREKEVGQVKERLEKYRLVTLTGSGGIGKTRLSIQIASELLDEYPNGVWQVELAPLTEPSLVTQAVCTVLDVTPHVNTLALNVLTDYLRSKKILLVMDNCEHLIDACAQLCDSLLHACPDLRIIASSREALGINGENAYRVPSLSLPHSDGGSHVIEESEAVKLFMERATTILPEFEMTETNAPVIAQICQRLDGIALAIELAASRVKILKVEQIASRLDDAFRLLTGGSRTAVPRQQTLRALIDWSYNLLTDEEKKVLRTLTVFMGGWTLEAAEAVCDNPNMLDLLTHLVDKSLVAVDYEHGIEARYYLLETIRQYAREKLSESGEGEQTRSRHLDYFLKLAQKEEHKIYGAGQAAWLQKLDDEYENIRTALEWSLQGNVTAGQQLTAALWWSWNLSGRRSEVYEWLEKMLAATPEEESLVRAKLLSGIGWMDEKIENRKEANEKSIAMFRKLGDEAGAAFPLSTLGLIAYQQSDYERAVQFVNESLDLFKRAGNKWGVRLVTGSLGVGAEVQGNFVQAQKYYEESLSICKEIDDKEGIGWNLYLMGGLVEKQGDHARSMELYEEALQIEKVVKSKSMITRLQNAIGSASMCSGDFERARLVFLEVLENYRKIGHITGIADSIESLGIATYHQGDFPKARTLYFESLQLFHRYGAKSGIADCLLNIAILLGTQGFAEKFVQILGMAEVLVPDIQGLVWPFIRTETEQFIEIACSTLGSETYTAAYATGHQMTLDEAVAYALKELGQ